MNAALEREIKLRFASVDEARRAVVALGAPLVRNRRLQQDALLDTVDGALAGCRSALRIRTEDGGCRLTFKGPPLASPMKLREELETEVADATILREVLARLGFRVWFHYEKYREEFRLQDLIVAIDDTPIGAYVELEGHEDAIMRTAAALGRGPADFIVASYHRLYASECAVRGTRADAMVFEAS